MTEPRTAEAGTTGELCKRLGDYRVAVEDAEALEPDMDEDYQAEVRARLSTTFAAITDLFERQRAQGAADLQLAREISDARNGLAVEVEQLREAIRALREKLLDAVGLFTAVDVEVLEAAPIAIARENPPSGAYDFYSPRLNSIAGRIRELRRLSQQQVGK